MKVISMLCLAASVAALPAFQAEYSGANKEKRQDIISAAANNPSEAIKEKRKDDPFAIIEAGANDAAETALFAGCLLPGVGNDLPCPDF